MKAPRIALALAVSALTCASCRSDRGQAVHVVGSTSILPFAEMLAEEFSKKEPGVRVEVQGGGSTHGLLALRSGIAEIGACSRGLHTDDPDEAALTPIAIAQDAIAVVVHPSNPLAGLSREELREVFSGKLRNWRELGGPDRPIRVCTREEGSGTLDTFAAQVMGNARITADALVHESNGTMKEVVKRDPCAIGLMSLGLVGVGLKALAVDGMVPARASGTYPLVRPFLFVVRGAPSGAAQRFIEFARSSEAQQLMEQERKRNATSVVRSGGDDWSQTANLANRANGAGRLRGCPGVAGGAVCRLRGRQG